MISKLISGNFSSRASAELLQPEKQHLHQLLLPPALSRGRTESLSSAATCAQTTSFPCQQVLQSFGSLCLPYNTAAKFEKVCFYRLKLLWAQLQIFVLRFNSRMGLNQTRLKQWAFFVKAEGYRHSRSQSRIKR